MCTVLLPPGVNPIAVKMRNIMINRRYSNRPDSTARASNSSTSALSRLKKHSPHSGIASAVCACVRVNYVPLSAADKHTEKGGHIRNRLRKRYTIKIGRDMHMHELTDISPHFHLVIQETHFLWDTDFSFPSYSSLHVTLRAVSCPPPSPQSAPLSRSSIRT
jgi:hypothetical protein